MSIFDPMCKANKLKKGGGVGYSEKNVFTFDGNIEEKPNVGDLLEWFEGGFYKISNKIPDSSKFLKVKGVSYGQEVEAAANQCWVDSESVDGIDFIRTKYGELDLALALIVHEGGPNNINPDATGLYFLCVDEFYITYMEFAETVHTIDPKYLTEVAPKVIDLDKYGISDIITSLYAEGGGHFETDGFPELWKDMDTTRPIIMKLNANALGAVLTTSFVSFVTTNVAKGVVTEFRILDGGFFVTLTVSIYEDRGEGGVVVKVTADQPT